jgi:hypothetical protein
MVLLQFGQILTKNEQPLPIFAQFPEKSSKNSELFVFSQPFLMRKQRNPTRFTLPGSWKEDEP